MSSTYGGERRDDPRDPQDQHGAVHRDHDAARGHDTTGGREQRRDVVAREKEEHGGIKWGSAFFGWLTATGMAILLTALLSAIGAAVGLSQISGGANQAENQASRNAETIGIGAGIALLVILFLAYLAGGYVAGRMARFDGAKQGIAVWLWAIIVAIIVAVLAAVAGSEFNILSQLNSLPRVPINEGDLTTGGIIAALAAVAATLGGAILGGILGMRFHRKVDRTGLGH